MFTVKAHTKRLSYLMTDKNKKTVFWGEKCNKSNSNWKTFWPLQLPLCHRVQVRLNLLERLRATTVSLYIFFLSVWCQCSFTTSFALLSLEISPHFVRFDNRSLCIVTRRIWGDFHGCKIWHTDSVGWICQTLMISLLCRCWWWGALDLWCGASVGYLVLTVRETSRTLAPTPCQWKMFLVSLHDDKNSLPWIMSFWTFEIQFSGFYLFWRETLLNKEVFQTLLISLNNHLVSRILKKDFQ